MIRGGMLPRSEGLRLHFINNRAMGLFLRVAASSNMPLNRSAEAMQFCLFGFSGRARLALRYALLNDAGSK